MSISSYIYTIYSGILQMMILHCVLVNSANTQDKDFFTFQLSDLSFGQNNQNKFKEKWLPDHNVHQLKWMEGQLVSVSHTIRSDKPKYCHATAEFISMYSSEVV